MRDLIDGLRRWRDDGVRAALATVVRTWNSAPRAPGAAMAVSETGEVLGSVSGGCVEGAVFAVCEEVIRTGIAARTTYGIDDDDAFAVGLTCGGTIEIFVEPVDAEIGVHVDTLAHSVSRGESVAMATTLSGTESVRHMLVWPGMAAGTLGDVARDERVTAAARTMLGQDAVELFTVPGQSGREDDGVPVFVQSFAPPLRMLVYGATDFASALARVGKFLGYRVTVCDARGTFATPQRFPAAAEVVVRWPHEHLADTDVDESTVICVLTHDPKFDIPLLEVALRSRAAYVGAMGSRRTHSLRLARLREIGLTEAQLARLSSPIGLDLGGRTPEETAVSIAAEITAARRAGTGARLADVDVPIHRQRL